MRRIPPACVGAAWLALAWPAWAAGIKPPRPPDEDPPAVRNEALIPVAGPAWWLRCHRAFVERAKQGSIELLFLGDSITEGWRDRGQEVWRREYAPAKAEYFGIAGDRTQHLLWRLQHGEVAGLRPKVVVLQIGTNNLRYLQNEQTAPETAAGVSAVVRELKQRLPESQILLLGIFPRDPDQAGPLAAKVRRVNEIVGGRDYGPRVHFLDLGKKFLDANGNLSNEVMHDYLHLTEKGYQIWADALRDTLAKLAK